MQSRHRAVKQLDLAEQLDDDAIDSEGDDAYDMDDEQYVGLSAVQNLLGPNTPISDKEIRDSLWDSYFDIDGTVAYLLGEREHRAIAPRNTKVFFPQHRFLFSADAQHKREAAKARAEGELTSAMAVETAEPPTSSLANLDISSVFHSTHPSATATATKPPMSKLAAKMAARKQAAADSKGSTPTETSLAPVAAVEGPKLSKLQQRCELPSRLERQRQRGRQVHRSQVPIRLLSHRL
ncbi:BQ5605_C137g13404 [Microbotryum silenes-dioicae]|uniref:BQ5605_C137g13404 protein n=1 Tax=Microbotryum silenes-dioicae TaxID=796604 RepID=A0A2X0MHT0_9BASI|nr:BQ5605_C137g13404 [Microbotryum silenes-dioicae]